VLHAAARARAVCLLSLAHTHSHLDGRSVQPHPTSLRVARAQRRVLSDACSVMAASDAGVMAASALPGSMPAVAPTKTNGGFMVGFGEFLKATQSIVDNVVVSPTKAVVDGTVKMAMPMANVMGGAVKGALKEVTNLDRGKEAQKREAEAAAVKVQAVLRGKKARASYSEQLAAACPKSSSLTKASGQKKFLMLALVVLAAVTAAAAIMYAQFEPEAKNGGSRIPRREALRPPKGAQ